MKVKINGQEHTEQFVELHEFDAFWKNYTKLLNSRGEMIHSVTIDEQTFYEGYEDIIINNFDRLSMVGIHSITANAAFEETCNAMIDYMEKLQLAAEQVSSPFYGEPKEADWGLLTQYLEGLHWLYQSCEFCCIIDRQWSSDTKDIRYIVDIQMRIKEYLEEMEEVMQDQQYVQLADIILYELSPWLQEVIDLVKGKIEHA